MAKNRKLYKKARNIWRNNLPDSLKYGKSVMEGYYVNKQGIKKLMKLVELFKTKWKNS